MEATTKQGLPSRQLHHHHVTWETATQHWWSCLVKATQGLWLLPLDSEMVYIFIHKCVLDRKVTKWYFKTIKSIYFLLFQNLCWGLGVNHVRGKHQFMFSDFLMCHVHNCYGRYYETCIYVRMKRVPVNNIGVKCTSQFVGLHDCSETNNPDIICSEYSFTIINFMTYIRDVDSGGDNIIIHAMSIWTNGNVLK